MTNITLSLTPENKAELERRAAAAGTDLSGFILAAVREKLDEGSGSSPDQSYEDWSRDFRCWVQSHQSRNPHFDDSRNSIYD
jgi:hypothetical protein